MTSAGVVVSLSLLFRAQWDSDEEPLRTWDWPGARPIAPPPEVRGWFVRASPVFILGIGVFVAAFLFVH